MTPEEARAELMRRFPGQTILAETNCWFHKIANGPKITTTYSISYNFKELGCDARHGNSFEECFAQLDEENKIINACIDKYSILLRKFIL